jgi:dynein heavy chain
MQLATEVLSVIPKPIDYQKTEKLIGADKKPLDIILLQEVSFFWSNFIQ